MSMRGNRLAASSPSDPRTFEQRVREIAEKAALTPFANPLSLPWEIQQAISGQIQQASIGVSQIAGLAGYWAVATPILTSETTTSNTFTNLATTGPTLTTIPSGTWIFFMGARISNATAANTSYMGIEVGATAASTDESATAATTNLVSAFGVAIEALPTGDGTTITAKYRTTGGTTATFSHRFLVGFRYLKV